MNPDDIIEKVEKRLLDGESKKWCYNVCKIWKIGYEEAVAAESIPLIKLFMEAGDKVPDHPIEGYGSISLAIEYDNIEIVKLLLKAGADVHTENDYPIHVACEQGREALPHVYQSSP